MLICVKRRLRSLLLLSSCIGTPALFTPVYTSDVFSSLLGFSAFAGFITLIIGWPLNNFIANRSVRIQKGVLAARDKRMGVLNELIGAVLCLFSPHISLLTRYSQVKFIKFFAWEERWIDRALDARGAELEWMVKGA